MKRLFSAILLFGTLLLFLLFPDATLQGAKTGLLLWSGQVLPSLLPFFILTKLLVLLGFHRALGKLLYPLFHPLFSLTSPGCFALVTGLLSGLPLGAKTVSELYVQKEISKREAILLLALCSNPSPMFLISYAGLSQLKLTDSPYLILLLVLASAFLCHFICRLLLRKAPALPSGNAAPHSGNPALSFGNAAPYSENSALPSRNAALRRENRPALAAEKAVHPTGAEGAEFSFALLDACMMGGFEAITKVGGYIILFNIYAAVLPLLLPFPGSSLPCLLPLCALEMTTGIASACRLVTDANLSLLLVVGCCCFGGLSGLAQTKSVLSDEVLSFGGLLLLKLCQCALGIGLCALFLWLR